jgi:2-phosphoglycerate kinase
MGRAAACGAALRNFELTKSGASDFATLKPWRMLWQRQDLLLVIGPFRGLGSTSMALKLASRTTL